MRALPLPAAGRPLAVSPRGLSLARETEFFAVSSYMDTSPIRSGSTFLTSFNLIYFFQDHHQMQPHEFGRGWGMGAQTLGS